MAEEKLHTDQENHQTEFYYNSPSGKHYIDMDLPPHWFRYFTEENEEVNCFASCFMFLSNFNIVLLFSIFLMS